MCFSLFILRTYSLLSILSLWVYSFHQRCKNLFGNLEKIISLNNSSLPPLLDCSTLSQRSLRLCSFFSHFSLCASFWIVCIAMSLSSVNFYSAISNLLLTLSIEFFISGIILFNSISSLFILKVLMEVDYMCRKFQ